MTQPTAVRFCRRAIALAVLDFVIAAGAAADAASPAEGVRASRIEEVTVTARRVEESLQSVPVAVTAITGQDLRDLRIEGFQTVGQTVPNLYINKQGGSPAAPQMNIRGVSNGSLNLQVDSGIGLYVDGIYLSRSGAAAFEMADLERVEVMRGPQGTLFGRNATGGAINLITAKPSGEAGLRIDGGFGNLEAQAYKVVVDTPEWHGLSARLVAGHQENEGDVDNIATQRLSVYFPGPFGKQTAKERGGDNDTDNAFLAVRYTGVDRLTVDFKYDYTDWNGTMNTRQAAGSLGPCVDFTNTPAQCIIGGDPANGVPPLVTPVFPYTGKFSYQDELASPVESHASNEVQGQSLTAQYELTDTLSIKYLFGHREYDLNAGANEVYGASEYVDTAGIIGGIPGGIFEPILALRVERQNQDSHELQLIGTNGPVEWILGGFYFNENGSVDNPIFLSHTFSQNQRVSISAAGFDYFIGQDVRVKNESQAAYAHATWHIEKFDLSGGLRYTEDDRKEFVKAAGFYGAVMPGNVNFDYSGDHTDYDVSLTYNFTDDVNAYVKYATGYVSGGTLLGDRFDPDEMKMYELGLKSELLDGTLRFNAALFRQERTDVQLEDFDASAGGYIMGKGDSIDSDGIELEAEWIPVEGLTLRGSYGYTNVDSSGDLRTFQPESTAYAGAQYDFAPVLGGIEPSARVDVSWRDDAYRLVCPAGSSTVPGTDRCTGTPIPSLDDQAVLDAVTTVNARLDFRSIALFEGATGKFGIWGRNLTDEHEMEFIFTLGGPTLAATYMQPRTYGVDFSVQF